MIKEYQTNIFFQILEKIVLKFKIAVIWFLALINFNFSISTIFCCICRWCSHFLDNLKEKSPKLEIKKKFYFHLISTFTQSCQKSEFYWEAGTQQNPNIKSARFCIVFMSSRILLCLQHCDIFNLNCLPSKLVGWTSDANLNEAHNSLFRWYFDMGDWTWASLGVVRSQFWAKYRDATSNSCLREQKACNKEGWGGGGL